MPLSIRSDEGSDLTRPSATGGRGIVPISGVKTYLRAKSTPARFQIGRNERSAEGPLPKWGLIMLRGILFIALSLVLLTWPPETRSAQANRSVTEAQWPGWQGAPGYGQEWEGRREHC
jgi:hypothetical protein